MFDIAWSEFLVVAVVALVVVGPKDLPALLRTVGKTVASLRRMAGEFQSQFNEAMREAELDDLKNEFSGLKDGARKMMGPNPLQIARDELKSAMADRATPSALAGSVAAGAAATEGVSASADISAEMPSAFAPPPPDLPPPEADAAFGSSSKVDDAAPVGSERAADAPLPPASGTNA